jgi:hypothetical protein
LHLCGLKRYFVFRRSETIYLFIRYRVMRLTLFINQNQRIMEVLDFVLHLPFWIGVLVGWKLIPYAVSFVKRFIKL